MIQTNDLLILIFSVSILLCILASLLLIGYYRAEVTIVRAGIFGIIGYFMAYIVISAFFFAFDYFSVFKCAQATLVAALITLVVAGIKTKFKSFKKFKFDIKELIFFVFVVSFVLLLSGKKFGFYGMGQDQGVYQTKAIELIYDNNSNVYNFDYALKTLSDPDDYTYFRDKVMELQGYYLLGQSDPFETDETMGGKTGLEGVYHGLPTWPAILALFGRMFGIGHMQECQTVFFICFLMLAFYILENFRIKTLCEAAALAILGSTPLIVWISKSALTEMFLAVIVAAFVYLVCNENRDVRFYMWIPVAAFSVYHVSAYTMMPLFAICGWMYILGDKRAKTFVSFLLMLASYFAGFIFSLYNSTLYTAYNYLIPFRKISKIFTEEMLTNTDLLIIVSISSGVCLIITIILFVLSQNKKFKELLTDKKEHRGMIIKLFAAMMTIVILYFYFKNVGYSINPNGNFIALSFATGLISILLCFVGIILCKAKNIKGFPTISIYIMFLYILLWSVLMRPDIQYFYYYGRYDVPYLIILVVFLNVIYKNIQKVDWIPAICAASVLLYLEYDITFCDTPDDTKLDWRVVEKELERDRLPNSAIIVDKERETLIEWMLILKASGAEVYPFTGKLGSQTENLSQYYDNIYFIFEDPAKKQVLVKSPAKYKKSYYYMSDYSEDIINGTETWIAYPKELFSDKKDTFVYLYKK